MGCGSWTPRDWDTYSKSSIAGKSDGLFMPLSSLADFTDISQLKEGDTITQLNGVTICEKYVPTRKQSTNVGG